MFIILKCFFVSLCQALKGSTSQGRCQSQSPRPQQTIVLRDHIRVWLLLFCVLKFLCCKLLWCCCVDSNIGIILLFLPDCYIVNLVIAPSDLWKALPHIMVRWYQLHVILLKKSWFIGGFFWFWVKCLKCYLMALYNGMWHMEWKNNFLLTS